MTPRHAIDPELAALSVLVPAIDLTDPDTARSIERAITSELRQSDRAQRFNLVHLSRPDGSHVSVAVHRPLQNPSGIAALPVLVFLHGGSFITGGLHSELERCAQYADAAECVVVSVEYRLAPEHPYPAALEDTLLVLDWLGREHDQLGIDRGRVAVGGLSAGANLAAASVLLLRRHSFQSATQALPHPGDGARELRIALQFLLFPVLDGSMSTASCQEFTDTPVLNAAMLELLWERYRGDADLTPMVAPGQAEDLVGSPPTFIACAQYDPLRDENVNFAMRLLQDGTPVDLRLYARTYHSFDAFHTTRLGQLARRHQFEVLTGAFR